MLKYLIPCGILYADLVDEDFEDDDEELLSRSNRLSESIFIYSPNQNKALPSQKFH